MMTIEMKLQNKAFGKVRSLIGTVDSIESAQEKTCAFIEEAELGSRNFIGALLFDENNTFVGYISYNGRFWDTNSKDANDVLKVEAATSCRLKCA